MTKSFSPADSRVSGVDFALARRSEVLQGEKFASTTARSGGVSTRDGNGTPTGALGVGHGRMPQQPQVVQAAVYVRDRAPIADVKGVAARGAPV